MTSALPDFVDDLGGGVFAIDTAFQRARFDAAYLLVHRGRAAFIDTGTDHAVPRHLAALAALGLARDAVDWIIPTHVHLDHAGGAGRLMQELPGATLLVHPRGAPHMIDPSALIEGALAIYGAQEMARSYGSIVAVDETRVRLSHDGMHLTLGGDRVLRLIDTPGHARHHHCVWDPLTRGWFTGDAFGSSYREFDTEQGAWMFPNTVPTQFDPLAFRATIGRLLAVEPACVYVTHFSRLDHVPLLARRVLCVLDAMVALASSQRDAPDRHTTLKRGLETLYSQHLAEHGVVNVPDKLGLLDMDIELNAQGIGLWLDRQTPSTQESGR